MHHLVEPILDGSLAAWFPRGTARALASWLGLLLLVATGAGALALDLTARRTPALDSRRSAGPAGAVATRRALVLVTAVCGAGAALAVLVRFSLGLS